MSELTEAEQVVADHALEVKFKRLRTRRFLVEAPDLVAFILGQVAPSIGGAPGTRVDGGDVDPLPLNVRAMEDANGVYAQLVNWTISHSARLKVVPPGTVLGWRRKDIDCDGFPSWVTPADATALTQTITDWLNAARHRIERLPTAEGYYDDVSNIIKPLLSRYRRSPKRPPFASRSCPVCCRRTVIVDFDDRNSLGYEDGLGYEETVVTVACTVCGHIIPAGAIAKYLEEKS